MKKILGLLLLSLSASPMAAEVAGQIGYMSGSMIAQRADGTVKVMAPNAQVLEGDVLATSDNGYAQVKMNDGTTMTMRPDSNLKIEAYKFKQDEPKADSAIFRLLKGGFRTVTGLIGKRGDPDAYKLRAATATIGIRGTDFSTRLCGEKDCQADATKAPAAPQQPAGQVVGRVMLLQGSMSAKDILGNVRKLLLGSSVYEGDVLNTEAKSQSVVAFRDQSRITLQESSSFYVEKFKYDKAGTVQESAVLRLLKGGVRVVTGLIGRVKRDDYKFGVAGATIGIRGTGFDAWCNGACATGGNPGASQDNPLEGAGVYVWSGEVVFITPDGSFEVALQQAAIIARNTGKPVPIMLIPKSIIENGAPRPDSIPVDFDKEFNGADAGGAGLYVTVHDGQIVLTQGDKSLTIGGGESGLATGTDVLRLSYMPGFFGGDSNVEFNDSDPKECVIVP
ncbi:MAG: FecR domain-containing protein [Nitrosomonadales bacterium]|nr:FecR domain-containing protein [Nitrosomonadales bacterium]